jgi:hypothetical protein
VRSWGVPAESCPSGNVANTAACTTCYSGFAPVQLADGRNWEVDFWLMS